MVDLDDVRTKELDVTVGGKKVSARCLGLGACVKLAQVIGSDDDIPAEDVARVVVGGLVFSETGKPVYSDKDIPTLMDKDHRTVTGIFQEIIKLSFSATEDAEKN